MSAAELQHAAIELAKKIYRADGFDGSFVDALDTAARDVVRPPFDWALGQRNGVWDLAVWERGVRRGSPNGLGDAI